MAKSKKQKHSALKAIYIYMICIISFTAIISSAIGLITGISNKYINPISIKSNYHYNQLEHSISNCMQEDQFSKCIDDQIEKEDSNHNNQLKNFGSKLNEQLAITFPMFFISLIIFIFHWKEIKKN